MTIDRAKKKFDILFPGWMAIDSGNATEGDTRFQIIDRMLVEVMGWERTNINMEKHGKSGYVDYLLSRGERSCLVLEAKRKGRILLSTRNPKLANYKLGGPALNNARDGVDQARKYCVDHGVSYSVLTSGVEWIFFVAIRTDGKPPLEGTAIAFPNLQSVQDNFGMFHDLLSRSGNERELTRVRLQEAEGLDVSFSDELYSIRNPRGVRLMQKSELAIDLEQVFSHFFGTMSGDNDPEMLAECFVETRESRDADATLDKIARTLTNQIRVVDTGRGGALARRIEAAVETRRGEFVLVIGNKGAGKSTFVDRFFRLVLDRTIREQCLVARVDLADSSGDIDGLDSWLTTRLKEALERELFDLTVPQYEELQGIFWKEYERWRKGEHKFLYEKDRNEFKVAFGQHIYDLVENHPKKYVIALLGNAVRARKLLPCVIFDNTDHFPQKFQESVFQYAQSIFRDVLCFVICPITDRTIWQLSKQGPLQSYATTHFYLPVPSTKDVLSKRVNFIKTKMKGDKTHSGEYFSRKGIRLSLSDIEAFAFCVEEIFINTEYLGRIVGWLSNHDIRRGLHIAQRITTSPILSIEELVKLYIVGNRRAIEERKIRQALILGNHNGFVADDSNFVVNVFQVHGTVVTTPLAKLSVLRVLLDKEAMANNPEEAYMTMEEVVNYCEPMGISRLATLRHCEELLGYRLIEPYDPTDSDIYMEQRTKITHSGRIHLEFALHDETYVVQMALASMIRSQDVVSRGREILQGRGKMSRDDWKELVRIFARYCSREDSIFVNVPSLSSYTGQRELRERFRRRWMDDGQEGEGV